MNNPMVFNGFPVYIAEPLNCKSEVTRTWKERLFTLPFTPLTKSKTINTLVDIMKDGEVIQNGNTLLMTISTWHQLQKTVSNVT